MRRCAGMPRQLRLIVPGTAVHVVQRGNDRMKCFRADSDFLLYLAYLRSLSKKFGCSLHAYCLMTNHVHLLLTPEHGDSCAYLMKALSQRYAHYFNTRYERTGTLWEGRYRSCVTESARYVLACYRYIELNPVRAGMTADLAGYPWSSYAVNSGERTDTLISPHAEMAALGGDTASRHTAYRRLLDDSLEHPLLDKIRDATSGGYPLVSDDFRARLVGTSLRALSRGRPGRPARNSVPDPDFLSAGEVS